MVTSAQAVPKGSTRRKGAKKSEVRQRLIEIARAIVEQEGSAAVTAGRLAKEVGLGRHTIHYYFGTIDELLAEVIRCSGDEVQREYEHRFSSGNPLRLIWNPTAPVAPLARELVALSARSEIVRSEVRHYTSKVREMLANSIQKYLDDRGFKSNVPPGVIAMTVLSISQALAGETELGFRDGHAEMESLVLGWIDAFEADGQWPIGKVCT